MLDSHKPDPHTPTHTHTHTHTHWESPLGGSQRRVCRQEWDGVLGGGVCTNHTVPVRLFLHTRSRAGKTKSWRCAWIYRRGQQKRKDESNLWSDPYGYEDRAGMWRSVAVILKKCINMDVCITARALMCSCALWELHHATLMFLFLWGSLLWTPLRNSLSFMDYLEEWDTFGK